MKVKEIIKDVIFKKTPKGFSPYIEIGDVDVFGKTYELKEKGSVSGAVFAYCGAILVSTVRPTRGAITVLKEKEAAVSNAFAILYPDEKQCLTDYLFFQLNNIRFFEYLGKNSKGATYPTCSKDDIYNYDIEVPSIEKQHEIVSLFAHVSKIIKKNKEEISLYDELVKARFVEMFGWPGTDIKGWGMMPLGNCCELNPKKGTDKRLKSKLEVSFVPMPAVTENGAIDTSEIKSFDEVKTGFTYFAENDVLFAKITPCMENGKGAVAAGLCNGIGFGSTEFHVLRPMNGKSNPYWIYTLTSFESFRKAAEANMTGSAGQRRVPASFLENYRVSLPPIELQDQFSVFVHQIDKSKFIIQESINKTQLLFDSLMQEYFG